MLIYTIGTATVHCISDWLVSRHLLCRHLGVGDRASWIRMISALLLIHLFTLCAPQNCVGTCFVRRKTVDGRSLYGVFNVLEALKKSDQPIRWLPDIQYDIGTVYTERPSKVYASINKLVCSELFINTVGTLNLCMEEGLDWSVHITDIRLCILLTAVDSLTTSRICWLASLNLHRKYVKSCTMQN